MRTPNLKFLGISSIVFIEISKLPRCSSLPKVTAKIGMIKPAPHLAAKQRVLQNLDGDFRIPPPTPHSSQRYDRYGVLSLMQEISVPVA